MKILVISMHGSTKFMLTQSWSSNLDRCLVEAMPIKEVWDKNIASFVMAIWISANKLGLILEPEGIG
jgi:hypothetical protein